MGNFNLYDMKLLERKNCENADMTIVRVPGGWIFIDYNLNENGPAQSQCFVPFDNEFQCE